MILKEKEKTVIQDLQTQEKSCVEKYGRYAEQAKDPELKNLFQTIQKEEEKNYDSLTQEWEWTRVGQRYRRIRRMTSSLQQTVSERRNLCQASTMARYLHLARVQ